MQCKKINHRSFRCSGCDECVKEFGKQTIDKCAKCICSDCDLSKWDREKHIETIIIARFGK